LAIDGASFSGVAGWSSILSEKRLTEQQAALDRAIAAYAAAAQVA